MNNEVDRTVRFFCVCHDTVEDGVKVIGMPASPRFSDKKDAVAFLPNVPEDLMNVGVAMFECYFNKNSKSGMAEADRLEQTIIKTHSQA